jgi:DNA-binding NarL/FixJ family response regulator
LLLAERDVTVVDEAPPSLDAIAAVARHRPAILLLEVVPLVLDAARALLLVGVRSPGTRVLLLSHRGLPDSAVLHALEYGAHGYLDASHVERSLGRAVRALDRGEPWLSRRLTRPILAALTAAGDASPGER